MIETRSAKINSRRIKAHDIKSLAGLVHNEYLRILEIHKGMIKGKKIPSYKSEPRIHFKINTRGDVQYSSETMELFNPGSILETKVVESFSIYYDYDLGDANISISISSKGFEGSSEIQVQGSDSTWVNGIFQKIQDNINTWQRQDSIFKKFMWPLSVLLGILTGFTIGWLSTLPLSKPWEEGGEDTIFIFTVIGILAFGAVLLLLPDYITKLWPNIEIVPALEHERILDKRRKHIKWVIVVILIPFIIAVVTSYWPG